MVSADKISNALAFDFIVVSLFDLGFDSPGLVAEPLSLHSCWLSTTLETE